MSFYKIWHTVFSYQPFGYTVHCDKSLDNFRAILRSATGTKLYSIERKFTNFIFRGTARNISTGFCFALTVSHRLYTTVQLWTFFWHTFSDHNDPCLVASLYKLGHISQLNNVGSAFERGFSVQFSVENSE